MVSYLNPILPINLKKDQLKLTTAAIWKKGIVMI